MKACTQFILGAFCVLALSGCEMVRHVTNEGFGTDPDSIDQQAVERSDYVEPVKVSRLSPTPPPGMAQPTQGFPPPSDRDLRTITSKLSGGSVQLFGVDGSSDGFQPRLPQAGGGMQSAVEPSVTVFPLSDNGPYPGQYSGAAGLQPLWPNAVMPAVPAAPVMSGGRSGALTPAPAPQSGEVAKIYFKHGSSRLGSIDRQVVRDASEKAKFSPVYRVSVEGHASKRANTGDPVRDDIVNLKESMNRAFEVTKTMMLNGVPAEKLETKAYGDTKPPSAVAQDPEAESRRVEIYTGAGY